MATVVISLGGSLVNPGKPDIHYINSFCRVLRTCEHNFGIVVGGGRLARIYAQKAKQNGANEFEADMAAIKATKQNAKTVIDILQKQAKGQVYPKVCNTFEEAKRAAKKYRFVLMGGTIPGITTDADTVLLAEFLHSKRVLNLSNVDAVYSANPHENPNAKKYATMTYQQLIQLAGTNDTRVAGTHFVFDFLACKLIARSHIETHFVHGRNLLDVKKAIEGRKHSGTVIK